MGAARFLPFATSLLAMTASPSARPAPHAEFRPAGGTHAVAYGEVPTASGYGYERFLDGSNTLVGPLDILFISGGFADNDFTREYALAYPSGALYAIDTSTALVTPIGETGLGSPTAGPRWDAATGKAYVMTTDCIDSVLYTIELATAATVSIGSSADTCIVAIAIDLSGTLYGVDASSDTLVSIDKATGGVQTIGSLGADVALEAAGMDVDPVSGLTYLIAFDDDAGSSNMYSVDTTTGLATLLAPVAPSPVTAFAFTATLPDSVFTDGFDGP